MTPDEFAIAVGESHATKSWPRLIEQLRLLGDEQLFQLLFPIAVASQWECPLALSAAQAIYEIKPRCQLSSQDAIRQMLDTWDISIEEVPWYLGESLGRQSVLNAVEELLHEPLPSSHITRLKTICYWLGTG